MFTAEEAVLCHGATCRSQELAWQSKAASKVGSSLFAIYTLLGLDTNYKWLLMFWIGYPGHRNWSDLSIGLWTLQLWAVSLMYLTDTALSTYLNCLTNLQRKFTSRLSEEHLGVFCPWSAACPFDRPLRARLNGSHGDLWWRSVWLTAGLVARKFSRI